MRILMYHQVVEGHPPDIHAVNANEFARQIRWLREAGYRSVYPEDALPGAGCRTLAKGVAITFDDGYLDFLTVALPILHEQGFVATVFLVAGLMGKPCPWYDSRPPLLTWAQARQAGNYGIRFGSHTMTHADLTALSPSEVEEELQESRLLIEQELGAPVKTFAYPYSRENAWIRRLVQDGGYDLACTYRPGYVGGPGRDAYQLQRIGILATDSIDDFAQKVNASLQRRLTWYTRLLRSRIRQPIASATGTRGS